MQLTQLFAHLMFTMRRLSTTKIGCKGRTKVLSKKVFKEMTKVFIKYKNKMLVAVNKDLQEQKRALSGWWL